MTRQYWRKQVRIILVSGKVIQEPKAIGERLIRSGQAIEVKTEARFTIRMLGPQRILETTP